MKPTPLSEYLSTPTNKRAPGWVVVMRGAGAPSVVHASRGAAEAEANRLIDGLPGTVDQTALVMPIASVLTRKKDVRQPVVGEAFPIELWPDGKMEADLAEIADATNHSRVVDIPLAIKEHGIYQRRDGKIVGPIHSMPHSPFFAGPGPYFAPPAGDDGWVYKIDGTTNSDQHHQFDLVREIVVGEEWRPWNGGALFGADPDATIDIVTRDMAGTPSLGHVADHLDWRHLNCSSDILAYRNVMPF